MMLLDTGSTRLFGRRAFSVASLMARNVSPNELRDPKLMFIIDIGLHVLCENFHKHINSILMPVMYNIKDLKYEDKDL